MPDVNILIAAQDKASGPLRDVGGEVDNLNNKAKSASSGGLASLGNALGTAVAVGAATGVAALVGLGGAVAVAGVSFNNMKEQAQIAFTTMLGSGQEAKVFLDDLQAFAAKTPFEFPELLMASQRLLAMGFAASEIKPTLTAVGDAVAGLGGGAEQVGRVTTALGQMQAKGKASSEEMMQLTEAGIPAWQFLADKIGVTVPEAMKQVTAGAVTADVAIDALVGGMTTKFGGLMEAQSKTFGGLFSTIKDTFSQVSGQIMQPMFEQMTAGLQMIVDWTSKPEFTDGVATLAAWLGKVSEQATAWAVSVWPAVQAALAKVWGIIQPLISAIGEMVKGLMTMKLLYEDGAGAVMHFFEQLGYTREAAQAVGRVFWELRDALENVMTVVWAAIAPVVAAIGKYVKWEDAIVGLVALMTGPLLAAIGGVIASLASFLAPILLVTAAVTALRVAWENDFGMIRTYTLNTLKKLSDWFYNESGLWKGTWDETWEYLIYRADRLIRIDLYNAIVGTWAQIRFLTKFHFTIIRDTVVDWAEKTIQDVIGWKDNAILPFIHFKDRVITAFNDWINPIKKTVSDFLSMQLAHFNQFVAASLAHWENLKEDAIELWNEWFGWFKPLEWYAIGKDIVDGLWLGVEEVWERFMAWWTPKWEGVKDQFEKVFDMHSPSGVFHQYGENLMDGLTGGIVAGLPGPQEAMRLLANNVGMGVNDFMDKIAVNIQTKTPAVVQAVTSMSKEIGTAMTDGFKAYSRIPLDEVESLTNSITAQMERLRGATVAGLTGIKTIVKDFNLDPATMTKAAGGTGKIKGVFGGSAGTLLLGGAGNKLPVPPQSFEVTKTALQKWVNAFTESLDPLNDYIVDVLASLNVTQKAAADKWVTSLIKTQDPLNDYLVDLMASLDATQRTAFAAVTGYRVREGMTPRDGEITTPGFPVGASAMLAAMNNWQKFFISSTDPMNDYLATIKDLAVTAPRDIQNGIGQWLKSWKSSGDPLNDFFASARDTVMARANSGAGNSTTNNFEINLQGSASASADLMSTFNLLNSMYGTAP